MSITANITAEHFLSMSKKEQKLLMEQLTKESDDGVVLFENENPYEAYRFDTIDDLIAETGGVTIEEFEREINEYIASKQMSHQQDT